VTSQTLSHVAIVTGGGRGLGLEGTGVTVNALLPGGPTLTGMVPETVSEEAESAMLDPSIMVPPLLWLVSPEAAEAATEQAGWA
jgi:NAD(P)-dependent dehydrogenase (short-subunit alcohol dehydrogenase family)